MEEDNKNICRVCLNCDFENKPGENLSLFQKYNDCVISDKINAITNVGITEGDGFPDRICIACLLELESAFNFKLKCEKTNEVLLSAVNNVPTRLSSNENALPFKEESLDDDDFNVPTQFESDDTTLPMKEEYLDEDSITLAYLQADDVDIKPLMEVPKPSRAIDLKLECHDCGGSFKSKCKLRVHWKKVHMTEKLKCPNCLRKFKTYAAYNTHKKQNLKSCATASKVRIEGEGRNRVFHCKDCSHHTRSVHGIASHIRAHTGERPFQCDICHKSYMQLSTLTSHKEGTHKMYVGGGTCHYCGKHILGRTKFYKHVRRHKDNHFPCKICNKVLRTSCGLANHMRRHSGVKTFVCEVCPSSFYTRSELSNHKTVVHLKKRTYKCVICNYSCYSHSAMKKHRPKHSASNIACDVCGFFLDNEQQLALHKKRHTDRHYQCHNCEKTYYSRKYLLTHIRKHHRIVKVNSREPKALKADSVKSRSCLKDK